MQKRIVTQNEAGQRLNKLLKKYLKEAPDSFIYKMLRKKNIVLNGRKADGSEKTAVGDEITLWLSDDTIEKFSGSPSFIRTDYQLDIIYEDSHMLLLNKPAGLLSQKAKPEDISVNEQMISYLIDTGALKTEELKCFMPSVVNRLDRNTSGLIAAGKSLVGLQALSALFKDRTLGKYYLCLAAGEIHTGCQIEGYLKKDEKSNKVTLLDKKAPGCDYIKTAYEPLAGNSKATLLKIELLTGRTHQIRAHLAYIGHPVIGDYKYGDLKINDQFKAKYHLKHQLLHAWQLVMPEALTGQLAYLKGRTFTAPCPPLFEKILKSEGLK